MTVYVLIREDQSEHGYIDASIVGIFQEERTAKEQQEAECIRVRDEGLRLEDDDSDGDWQVSIYVEHHHLS